MFDEIVEFIITTQKRDNLHKNILSLYVYGEDSILENLKLYQVKLLKARFF